MSTPNYSVERMRASLRALRAFRPAIPVRYRHILPAQMAARRLSVPL